MFVILKLIEAGACRGQQPLSEGMQAAMDNDLIMWLTKDLAG